LIWYKKTFKEIFDKVIEEKHNFGPDQRHVTDFDGSKLADVAFDPAYVLSIRLRTIRNIRGYCLPPFVTRGERRDLESVIVKALYNLDDRYKGTFFSLKDLSDEEEKTLTSVRNLKIGMLNCLFE
jgi:creatine kinase